MGAAESIKWKQLWLIKAVGTRLECRAKTEETAIYLSINWAFTKLSL